MMTLAEKLGLPDKASVIMTKAASVGLHTVDELETLAVARGCWHYERPQMAPAREVSRSSFTDEELAIALLSPYQPYSPAAIRLGAAMLGSEGNDPGRIAALARDEGAELSVRYVAQAGLEFEPDSPFWQGLLDALPSAKRPRPGVFPHPTRFVSMTGITRAGVGKVIVWIRPRADLALAHG